MNTKPVSNLIGSRFGRLTVKYRAEDYFAPIGGKRMPRWGCACDCGGFSEVFGISLKAGKTVSCGCRRLTCIGIQTHGMTKNPLYPTWKNMMDRCYKSYNPAYHNYGGRGIKVDPEWWDVRYFAACVSPKPDGTSLDRPNNNANYGPLNWRWATKEEQANNTRVNVKIEIAGEIKSFAQWCRVIGINDRAVDQRRRKKGMSHKEAILSFSAMSGVDIHQKSDLTPITAE